MKQTTDRTRKRKIGVKNLCEILFFSFLFFFFAFLAFFSKSNNLSETVAISPKTIIFNDPETIVKTPEIYSPEKTIYLTFDDGPGPYTNSLLDILKKYNVKATFFVTSSGDDETIRRAYDEGHTIALHTSSHVYSYIYSSVDNYFADLYAVQNRVKNITGETVRLIRFPGGSSNTVSAVYDGGIHIMSKLTAEVQNRGFVYFDWNITSGDAGGATTSGVVANNVISHLQNSGPYIVLQHDIKSYSVDAVAQIIKYGQQNGYVFAPLKADSYSAHHGINN